MPSINASDVLFFPLSTLLKREGENFYVGRRWFKANRTNKKQPKLSIRHLANKNRLCDH